MSLGVRLVALLGRRRPAAEDPTAVLDASYEAQTALLQQTRRAFAAAHDEASALQRWFPVRGAPGLG